MRRASASCTEGSSSTRKTIEDEGSMVLTCVGFRSRVDLDLANSPFIGIVPLFLNRCNGYQKLTRILHPAHRLNVHRSTLEPRPSSAVPLMFELRFSCRFSSRSDPRRSPVALVSPGPCNGSVK